MDTGTHRTVRETPPMPRAKLLNSIEIEYETFGHADHPALLLVSGFTSQMTSWEDGLCNLLAGKGRFVIRFDNRDVGLSTHLDGQTASLGDIRRARKERTPMPVVPYTLSDFAADGIGVLDDLGIDSAHIAGSSMGGMIVQTMAIEHSTRVASLTSIMSNTGEHRYGRSTPEADAANMRTPAYERSAYISQGVENRRIWSSERYYDPEWEAFRLGRDFDRMFYPQGSLRQAAAVMVSPSRADALRALQCPTLVLHGRNDALIDLSGGERTAELVSGSKLVVLSDMAHDLPRPLWPFISDLIVSHTAHIPA